ncbi:tyrosine-type recombinase/integrase [Sphingosinicella humi]|nr:tyrosine-type recombinase/integrase [Sphingosinicella humi]
MLNQRVAADGGLTEAELQAIAKTAYEQLLAELCQDQRSTPYYAPLHSVSNLAFAHYYQRLADHGGHLSLLPAEEQRLAEEAGWDPQRIEDLRTIIKLREEQGVTRFRPDYIDGLLRQHGRAPTDMLRWAVELALYPAFRDAHIDAEEALQRQLAVRSYPTGAVPGPSVPARIANDQDETAGSEASVPSEWLHVTATEAAERLIAATPKMFEHRKTGKRKEEQVGEQTLRQIRWAAALLERSMDGRPLWSLTFGDLKVLDQWFDRLPVTCGKAPWHRSPETTLKEICRDAEEKIELGDYEADAIGLLSGTTNKHFRKLAQIHSFLRDHVPSVAEVDFGKFMVPDRKDERNARAAYTLEQGRELFNLPPWTGCRSVEERLEPGNQIYHDSLFFVLLLVWYTGMRREEVCKLLVTDVDCVDGIWFISIDFTSAGRVKNRSAVRLIAISDELVRLGFVEYFEAIRTAGHDALFPELVSERAGAKKGDTFYKLWWIYVAPHLKTLQRGQALHAARHTVSTELKELEVFEEHRNDALGHKGKGEGSTRYSKATRLAKLKALVDQIPIVTDHLPDYREIHLLPAAMRRPRPRRGQNLTGAAE